jgi:hypothetical protein
VITPYTSSALKAARGLADNYHPVTPQQSEAQARIYAAVATGNLDDITEALRQARVLGTEQWRQWHTNWLLLVQRHMLDDDNDTQPLAA